MLKVAILGSSGHYALALVSAGAAASRRPAYSLAPVEEGEDMAPVERALREASPAADKATSGSLALAVHGDWLQLLDAEKPDVAVVNPPFHRIAAVAQECLRRGIHVLAEKPLATTWEDLQALRALCRPSGPRLMAMLTMRYDGAFRAARRALAEGGLGEPVLLSIQKSYPLQGWDGGPRPAFYHRRSTYGGTIPWAGIHAIDLIRWFSGSEFAAVAAAHTRLGNGGEPAGGELESAAVMQFKLASGALATANLDFLRPRAPGLPADASGTRWGDDRLRVACTRGVLEVRDGRAFVEGPDGIREIGPEPELPLFAAFLDWVEKGDAMALTTEDCLLDAEASLRARDAADLGRVLEF